MTTKKYVAIAISVFVFLSIICCYSNLQAQSPDTLYWIDGDYSPSFGGALSIKTVGDYLYMSCHTAYNYTIFDISTRSDPTLVGIVRTSQRPREASISLDGNYAFVSTDGANAGNGTVMIINCTDKTNPVEMSTISPLSSTHIEGAWYVDALDVVFCADYDNDCIHSIDVSDKNNPALLDTQTGSGDRVHAIWANETVACTVSYGSSTFVTYDVSNPSSMSVQQSIGMGANPAQVCGTDNPIIYASSIAGHSFSIFDITNPSSIVTKSTTSISATYGIDAIPDTSNASVLYVTSMSGGYSKIHAYNKDDLTNPTEITSITNTNTSYYEVACTSTWAVDNYIYSAVQYGQGLTTFRFGEELFDPPNPGEEITFTKIDEGVNNSANQNVTPLINWTIMENTSNYQLHISNDSGFTDIIVNLSDINEGNYPSYYTETSTIVSFLLPSEYALPSIQYYYYRVKAYSVDWTEDGPE